MMKSAPLSYASLLLASVAWETAPVAGAQTAALRAARAESGPSRAAAVLLWDQLDFPTGDGLLAQDDPDSDASDSEAADDFVVPWGESWEISRVVVHGSQHSGGSPDSADVRIYPDDGGKPAPSAACAFLELGVGSDPWDIALPPSCILTGGVYWLAAQANQSLSQQGEFVWKSRAARTGYPGRWRNPGDGLGWGCTGWTTCGPFGSPDFLFQIYGSPTGNLVHQGTHASTSGVLDQNFEPDFDQLDSAAADDFIVLPKGGWLIRRVRTFGTQATGGSPESVDVRIHVDEKGFPSPIPTCEFEGLATANAASLDVVLGAQGCRVSPGSWWLEIQVNQTYGSGAHLWLRRTVQIGNPALFRNPLDGWETGCTDWDTFADCLGGADPDLLFVLEGAPVLVFEDGFEIQSGGRWTTCSGCV